MKKLLLLLIISASLLGFDATAPEVCHELLKNYEKLSSDRKTRDDFLSNKLRAIEYARERYKDDTETIQKLNDLELCTKTLQSYGDFAIKMKELRSIQKPIDPSKIPDQKVVDDYCAARDKAQVTSDQAWALYNCEPCQYIKSLCLNENGNFDIKKVEKLRADYYHRSFQIRNDNRGWFEPDYHNVTYLFEDYAKKAKIMYACIEALKQKAAADDLLNNNLSEIQ